MRIVWFRNGFSAYWREGDQSRRVALRTKDRAVAERRLADLEVSLRRKAATVREIIEAYLDDKATTAASIANMRFTAKQLLPVFGNLRPDQIDRARSRAYALQRRRAGRSDGTIIKELAFLRAALRWQDRATGAVIELPRTPAPKSRHLSREQYRALREAAAGSPHVYLFIVLAYTTAGRASAILDLTWDRVDFPRGMIRLGLGDKRAKGRATVPMTDGAREALTQAQRAAISDYVIEYAGRQVGSVKRGFAAAARRAGVPWCTPHALRHTAAVHMAESGVPIEEIAQFLGHSSAAVTYRVYARFSPAYLRRAASALEC